MKLLLETLNISELVRIYQTDYVGRWYIGSLYISTYFEMQDIVIDSFKQITSCILFFSFQSVVL